MDLVITLGLGGWAILIVGSLIFGGVAQFVGETRTGFEWLVDALAAGIGALVASEFIVSWQTAGPVVDGLALVPALVGGLVVGLAVEIGTRLLTGGHYRHQVDRRPADRDGRRASQSFINPPRTVEDDPWWSAGRRAQDSGSEGARAP